MKLGKGLGCLLAGPVPGRFQLQNPHPLDRRVVRSPAGSEPNPPGVLQIELLAEQGDLFPSLYCASLASGVYRYRVNTAAGTASRTMVLVK